MNAVLDYDTLEILGAAIRAAGDRELDQPLPADLRSLCDQLDDDDHRSLGRGVTDRAAQ